MSREQSSMTSENPVDRFRRNWAISFLSIILFMFDKFLLIRFSSEVVLLEQNCSSHSSHSVTASDSTSSATPFTCSSARNSFEDNVVSQEICSMLGS